MGAIIDFSTDVAFFTHLTDQSSVQLERETKVTSICHLWKIYFQKQSLAKISCRWSRTNQKEKLVVLQHLHHIICDKDIRQHKRQVTPDQPQTANTTPVSHTRQLPGSMQHYTTNVASLTVKTNESDSDVSVGSRRTQKKNANNCWNFWERYNHDVEYLKAMTKDLLVSKEGKQEKPLLEFARMTRSQLADKARQQQIPVSDSHVTGHLIKITRETLRSRHRKNSTKRRKTPEQKVASSTRVLEEENLSLKEQVPKLTEQVQLLMTSSQERGAASSAESSAEWQKPAGEIAMSTLNPDEMSWIEKQVTHSTEGSTWDHLTERPRLVLVPLETSLRQWRGRPRHRPSYQEHAHCCSSCQLDQSQHHTLKTGLRHRC